MSNHTDRVFVFLFGFLGALAPEIVRLYEMRWKPVRFSYWYFGISFVFAIVGGIVALVLPATNFYAAFYAGITAPVAISAATKHRKRVPINKDLVQIQASRPSTWKIIKSIFQTHADGLF